MKGLAKTMWKITRFVFASAGRLRTSLRAPSLPVPSLRAASLLAASVLAAIPAFSADTYSNCASGIPFAFPNGGRDIPYHTDLGNLGLLDHDEAVELTGSAFGRWADLPESSVSFLDAGSLPFDVTIASFAPILFGPPNGRNEVLFDDDGSIVELLFGVGSGVAGFAYPTFGDFTTCELTEGVAVFNGALVADPLDAEDTMVHELGHLINLGHVELNGQLIGFPEGGDTSGPTPDGFTFGPIDLLGAEAVETMYPISFSEPLLGTRTPHADDVASVATLYPAPGFHESTGRISGAIYAADGVTRLSGVNVIARNLADPYVDAVSTFSGAYTDGTGQDDPNVGAYVLNNLTPGATYALFIDQVSALAGRFSTPIITVPGPEEYWNAGESNDDRPLDYTGILVTAGVSVTGIDIVVNEPRPLQPLYVGEDGAVELSIGFQFEICGERYDTVFVNANGLLTFGAPDPWFIPNVPGFLAATPRVAGLWNDLSPFRLLGGAPQGVVTFDRSANRFTAYWVAVPEYPDVGANTFSVTLKRASNGIDVQYHDLTATRGIAGVSCGGRFALGDEQAVDLSSFDERVNLTGTPAAFESFDFANPFDLVGDRVEYNGTKGLEDQFEDNDSPEDAALVRLPFATFRKHSYAEIWPAGDDVDWFAFEGEAGDLVVAEVVGGQLDSLIALFDPSLRLLATDDDGGSGLLSKIGVALPATGRYLLAVTTFPDFGLTGAGWSGGRYLLEIDTVEGELPIGLDEDGSVEMPLPFSFPFQGESWDSVFVNANGNLTFGAGDFDWTESAGELLAGPPRIAPLWRDLSPQRGGSVSMSFDDQAVTVRFEDVPEFPAIGANTFSLTLRADGGISFEYGGLSTLGGLAGISEGAGAADPGETDLSDGGPFGVAGTTYELFVGDNDLAGATISFEP